MRTDFNQLEFLDVEIRKILKWLKESTGLEFTITSLYRIGDKGVHGTLPVRGTDLRNRSIPIGQAICKHINEHWQYDPERPELECAVLHGKGSKLHIHLQVHPGTIRL